MSLALWMVLAVPASADLVGYWTFDGDNADDSSGNNYHGTLSGGAFSSDTPAVLAGGRSLDLTGGNDYVFVDTGGTQDVFDLDTFTVAGWVQGWPADWSPFISKNGEEGGWQMRRHGGNQTLDFTTRGTQPSNGDMEGRSTIVGDGDWHHVAMTVQWDGANIFVKTIYVDGQFDARRNDTQNGGDVGIRDTTDMLAFGARHRNGAFGNYLNGKLDDIAIYNEALGPAQVAHLGAGGDPTNLPAASDPVPAPWVSDDVGNTLPGSTQYVAATDTYIISGDGGDIWSGNDRFHFMHQPVDGDFNAVVRMLSQQNTDGWAKAGIMARNELTNNSPYVAVSATPSNQVKLQAYPNQNISIAGSQNSGATPYWLALSRRGDTFTAKWAPDAGGMPGAWSEATHTQALNAALELGLHVTSHDGSELSMAVFDNVAVGNVDVAANLALVGPNVVGSGYATDRDTGLLSGPTSWRLERITAFQALRDPSGNPGLQAEWFPNETFTDPPGLVETVTRIQRDSGSYPAGWTQGDNFSVRYSGEIFAPFDGTFVFEEKVDDEMWLSIDGTEVHHDGSYSNTSSVAVDLTEGWHDIEFRTREGGGGDDARLSWDMGIGEMAVLEADALIQQVLAEGFDNAGGPGEDTVLYRFGPEDAGKTIDLRLTANAIGEQAVALTSGQFVPEPSSYLLLALGGLGLLVWRRRTRG